MVSGAEGTRGSHRPSPSGRCRLPWRGASEIEIRKSLARWVGWRAICAAPRDLGTRKSDESRHKQEIIKFIVIDQYSSKSIATSFCVVEDVSARDSRPRARRAAPAARPERPPRPGPSPFARAAQRSARSHNRINHHKRARARTHHPTPIVCSWYTPLKFQYRAPQTTPTHEPALTVNNSLPSLLCRVDCDTPISVRYCIKFSPSVGAEPLSDEPG